jgi:hypothetical protein
VALPDQLKNDVAMLRSNDFGSDMGTPPGRLASYAFAGFESPADSAKAMLEIRDALGNDAVGRRKFVQVLETGQQVTLKQVDPEAGNRAHAAFGQAVASGAIGPDDAKGMVDAQIARFDGGPHTDAKVGQAHVGLTRPVAELSSYVDALGHDDKSNAVRSAFAHECIDQAIALREKFPAMSAALYANAANAIGDMPPAQVQAELADITRKDGPQGLARFAAGAASGEAERAKPIEVPAGRYELRADGLANVMQKVNARIEAGNASGVPDRAAESMGGQLFTGTTAFLNAARGTELDHNLNDNDERTGLRTAMNATMKNDFPAIYRQNAQPDGEGLVAPGGGFDTFSAYARFEFDAPGNAHGNATANEAAKVLGQKYGTLAGDLLKAERDGGADLRRDFGAGTFGDRAHEQGNAAMAFGELVGATRNGINQGFDARADRSGADQKEMKEGFERASTLTQWAGKAATKAVGEEAAPAFEGAAKVFDALANATPQAVTTENGRGVQFDNLERDVRGSFSQYRPNHDLTVRVADGSAHANTEWAHYQTDRSHGQTQSAQLESQQGLLSSFMAKHMLPTPDDPAKAAPHQEIPKGDLAKKTAEAVEKYNATHRDKLPNPTDVAEWNGTSQKGVVLQVGPEDYVISSGRGGYRHFDTEQTHGVHPVPEKPADLNRDGTIHQNVRGVEALAR